MYNFFLSLILYPVLILMADRTVAFSLRIKCIYKIYLETPNIISSLQMIPVTCFPSDNSELYEVHTYS